MMLRIAIQKSGRLSEESLELIRECNIKVNNGKGKLKSDAVNFPMEILYLRDDDIPGYVADGVADVGIAGLNVVREKWKNNRVVMNLGFSRCRLSLAIPKELEYHGLEFFRGRNIATSYPNLTGNFLREKGINADIHEISGSVEIAPGIGLADAICDIVSSGSTLISNGLKEVETILQSEAVLIAGNALADEKEKILDQFLFRINAVQKAKSFKYILLNAPNEKIDQIINILPGMKSPTVVPLAMEGWSSLHSVINEEKFWEIIDSLKQAGAQGILVVPIEKMIM
jgi:ATP phosphoribosyltransferase